MILLACVAVSPSYIVLSSMYRNKFLYQIEHVIGEFLAKAQLAALPNAAVGKASKRAGLMHFTAEIIEGR